MGHHTGSGYSRPRGRAQPPRDRTEAGAPAADPVLVKTKTRKGRAVVSKFSFFKFVFTLGFLFYLVSIYLFDCASC